MKNRLYDCICVFVIFAILQSSICHARVVNDSRRTKRETSVDETSRLKRDTSYAKQINLEHKEKRDDNPEEDDAYQDAKEKRKISREAADPVISADSHPSDVEESFEHDDVSGYLNSRRSIEEAEKADEEAIDRDKNEAASNIVHLSPDIYVNDDLERYTDQDEGASLYDDYEAKDVAKRGVLSGPEDYEEVEDDSSRISEDMAAVQEPTSEAEKRETRKDARMKRDQVGISEMFDKSMSSPDNPVKLEESKTMAKNSYSLEVPRVELSKDFNKALASNDGSKMKGSKDVSKLSDAARVQESTDKVISSKKDESNDNEKRVEEEIQRKIDSLKKEIQRDIEARQRIRNIEDNNAIFDELQDQELEDEERQKFKDEPIKKRQIVAKRSICEAVNDAAGSSNKNEQSSKIELHKKRQHRFSKSDTSKENLKKRFVDNYNRSSQQVPSKKPLKKKREHVRQIFLTNNDQHQAKKKQSRSYPLPSDRIVVRRENELPMNPDSNSHLRTDDKMLQVSLPIKGETNEGEQGPTAKHSDSLVSLTGSSQELSLRLEKEYKEAFGGLQSEPGSALARFKRIKRVLANAKT